LDATDRAHAVDRALDSPPQKKVFHNAPIVIAKLILLTLFWNLIASAVHGCAIYRDLEHKTGTFVPVTPSPKIRLFHVKIRGFLVRP